ncbi:MAG: hypothetical protein RLZZ28_2099 [Bacteroidota bacterium]
MKNLFGLFLSTAIFSCSGVKVMNTESAADADFSKAKTFGFYTVKASGDTITESFSKRIVYLQDAIGSEMKKRGFTNAGSNPDLLINIGIVVQEKVQTRETNWQQDGRFTYVGQRNYTWKSTEVELGRYREGTVTVHIVDALKNNMMWKGSANGVIPEKEKNIAEAAQKGMEELFKKFPVAAK